MAAIAMACETAVKEVKGDALDRIQEHEITQEITAPRRDSGSDKGWTERQGARAVAPGIEACYSFGMEHRQAAIQSISPTGIFLLTEDRWLPGMTVQLTLRQKSGSREDPTVEVRMPARVVRQDMDGVGMEFLLGKTGTSKWLELFSRAVFLTEEDDPIRVFRVARALAFLLRIAPPAESRILEWIAAETCQERVTRATGIALRAESLMTAKGLVPRIGISSNLVWSLVEEGSKPQGPQAQPFWAEVLVSACVDAPRDGEDTWPMALSAGSERFFSGCSRTPARACFGQA